MLNISRLNCFLSSSTALIGVGLVSAALVSVPLQTAKAVTVSTSQSGPINLSNGNSLIVTGTGDVSGATIGVNINSVTVVDVDNAGSIQGTVQGIKIQNGGTISNTLTNSGTILGSGGYGIYVKSGTITNFSNTATGDITGRDGDAAIHLEIGSTITNTLHNAGTITGSGEGIRLDSSSMTDLVNDVGAVIEGKYHSGSNAGIGILLTNTSSLSGILHNSGSVIGVYDEAILIEDSSAGSIINYDGALIDGGDIGIGLSNGSLTNLTNESNADITARDAAIYLEAGSDITGTLSNSGDIYASSGQGILLDGSDINNLSNETGASINGSDGGAAIELTNASSIYGAFDNAGTISGTGTAILLDNSTMGDLVNDAGALIEGIDYSGNNVGTGILLTNGATLTGSIDNSGSITGEFYAAISLEDSSADTIINRDGGLVDGGDAGISLDNSSLTNLTNESNATITADDTAIYLEAGSDISGTLSNSGDIYASNGQGIVLDSSDINILSNEVGGTITGNNGESAIELRNGSAINDSLFNAGTISGSDAGISLDNSSIVKLTNETNAIIQGLIAGVALKSGSVMSGSLTNKGTIKGDIGLVISGSSITGGVTNTGTIEGTGGTAISMEGLTSLVTFNLNDGRIIGDITDDAIGNEFSKVIIGYDFTTEGDITVSDLVLNADASLTISAGDIVTLNRMTASTGSLDLELADANTTSLIKVTGAGEGINLSGLTVSVTVGSDDLNHGHEMLVGSGNATVIGLDGGLGQEETEITDTSLLWNFVIADGAQDIIDGSSSDFNLYLVVQKILDIEDVVTTANHLNMAVVLNELDSSSDPQLQQIWETLNNAETDAEINDIIEALQSDISGGTVSAATFTANTSFDITSNRLLSVRTGGSDSSGISSGDITKGLQIWLQAFGEIGAQNERDNIAGFDLASAGVIAGIDSKKLLDDGVIGAALGYSVTAVDSMSTSNAQTDITSYQITAYGDYDLGSRFFVNGMMAYAYHDNEGSRVPTPGLVAKSKFAAHQYVTRLEIGRDIPVGDFTVTPSGMGQFAHYNPDSYTETGAGGANLTVDQASTNSAELGAGMDIKWSYNIKSGGKLETTVGAQYRYDFIGDAVSTSSNFVGGGSAIQSTGFDPAQSTVDLGAGIRYQMDDSWEVSARYDFEYKQDYRAHTGSLRAAYSF